LLSVKRVFLIPFNLIEGEIHTSALIKTRAKVRICLRQAAKAER
jgi:hypothetical protein